MSRSESLFLQAQTVIPGGVNSPVRAFRSVGGTPIFFTRGEGACLFDADGKNYLDLVNSWGPLLFGHADPTVVSAVCDAAKNGLSFGACHEGEVRFAETLCRMVPSLEKVRLVSSGTEAAMSFLRLARGFSDKKKIVKFEGCYHGHSDALLAKAGSGIATLGLPDSAGVPPEVTAHTLTLPYNNLDAVRDLLEAESAEIAAIALEPVAGNMGCVAPKEGYLAGLRELCDAHGVLLLFDEVMTGFRLAVGGAQERFGVTPDLTALGKIVGGGLPLAAYGGRAEIMDCVAPLGPVYQAGTLSGNPVAVAAGQAMLDRIQNEPPYAYLEEQTSLLAERLRESAARHKIPAQVNQVGSMLTLFFTDRPVTDYASAKTADAALYGRFFHQMLERGVYLPPSAFEAAFTSAALSADNFQQIADTADEALKML